MTANADRNALINGLRGLAAFLDSNPDIPAPRYASVSHHLLDSPDEEMRAEIDTIARYLGAEIDSWSTSDTHYSTTIRFGPVEYRASAILSKRRAEITAELRHSRCHDCGATGVDSLGQTCESCQGQGFC
ncbi:hypothetical protein [Sphaerisporangium fuscum]|uniref:hypothetical protein n=1 Tax=Sphaerisporangium fuscum TaxID=2835868 RepID=UPI001BDBBE00|nr:hypothetical protein [Sphaerisporangium fuscum]